MRIRLDTILGKLSPALDVMENHSFGASANHGKRVACLCAAMGRQIGLQEDEVLTLTVCALLHDNALSEYSLPVTPVKDGDIYLAAHCRLGQANVDLLPLRTNAAGLVLYHHEKPDASGPFGKREFEMAPAAALIAVADAVDLQNHLQTLKKGDLSRLTQTIKDERCTKYSNLATSALLSVLDVHMLEMLRNENIEETFALHMPKWSADITSRAMMALASFMAHLVDFKSKYTRDHSSQLATAAWGIAKNRGLSDIACAEQFLAAALHDMGDLYIPLSLLEKPTRLSPAELRLVQSHPKWSYNMFSDIEGLENVNEIILNHHERLDGSGYPYGKDGRDLDFSSRLAACLEIYQSITEHRAYHTALSHRQAMKVMQAMAKEGKIDGDIVANLGDMLRDFPTPKTVPPLTSLSGNYL